MLLTLMSNLKMFGTVKPTPHPSFGEPSYEEEGYRLRRMERIKKEDEEIIEICKAFLISYN